MNPNDTFRFKLTKTGKMAIVRKIDALNESLKERGALIRLSTPCLHDGDWLEAHFTEAMDYFSGMWGIGRELPFTEMEPVK
jgi:hypothetical protein